MTDITQAQTERMLANIWKDAYTTIFKKLQDTQAQNAELLEALEELYNSFTIHGAITGNKGNKAKHDVIMYNKDVRKALNTACTAIERCKNE